MAKRVPKALQRLVRTIEDAFDLTPHDAILAADIFWPNETDNYFQVSVYPLPIETWGGPNDGARRLPSFCIDLDVVLRVFSRVERVVVCVAQPHDLEAPNNVNPLAGMPHNSIFGKVGRLWVWAHILLGYPEDAPSGLLVTTSGERKPLHELDDE